MPGSGSPVSCGLDIAGTGFLTTDAYVAGQTTVTQGAQTRIFKTDWLGRSTSVQEPESGTATYAYSLNSTGMVVTRSKPTANQTSSSVTTTTTTQYDTWGRVLTISYSDGTPTKTYAYDTSAGWGQSQTNIKGRLSKASVPILGNSAITIDGYDAMGRTVLTGQCFPIDCSNSAAYKYITDSYDWAGNLTNQTDPTAGSIGNSYSAAGEITQITGNYSVDGSSSGTTVNLVSSVQNGPNGPLNYQLGNGLGTSFSYDTLGRRNGGWVCSGSTQNYCTGGTQLYGYATSWTGSRLTGISDTILNKQITYGYDSFNRLTSLTVNSGVQQNFTYGYDRYGNRWQQDVTAGSGPQPQLSFNSANNQIQTTGYSYDAAGNLRSDGVHNYSYDAEGNLTQVDAGSTANYAYDALNHRFRVQNSTQTVDYTFDYLGRRVTTWEESSDYGIEGKMYWGTSSTPISFRNGPTYFEHQDWLGTERLRTNYAGATAATFTSLPFGDGYTASSTDADPYHYAGLDRDSESTTDHAQFRQYAETSGRWMRPDPYLGSYIAGNPQSFNRYSYVLNNPLTFVDQLGLDCQLQDANSYDSSDGANCDPGGGGNDPNNPGYCSGDYCTSVGGNVPLDPPIDTGNCAVYGCGITSYIGGSGGGAPNNTQSQQIVSQISAVNNCTVKANAAMNAGPSVTPTSQNVIDGIVAATFTIATDGAATAFSVLKNFFKGSAIRSAGHAAQNGLIFLATYHNCLAATGQGSPYNPYSPF